MKNIQQLRSELADNFNKLKSGELEVPEAAEMNNTAGKIIQTVAMELKQSEIIQSKKAVPFLSYDGKELPSGADIRQIEG